MYSVDTLVWFEDKCGYFDPSVASILLKARGLEKTSSLQANHKF